ncbi:MAG: hypothetical protein ABWW65_06690 [Thermoprotei archaeon]
MAKKIKEIGIKLENIDHNKLVEILTEIERAVRRYLTEKLPHKADYDLILSVEKNDKITLLIDIGIIGVYEDIIDYESIARDAVNVARRVFEERIKEYRGSSKNTS